MMNALWNSILFKQDNPIQLKPVPEGGYHINNMSSSEREKMEQRNIQKDKERYEKNKIENMYKSSTYIETKRNKVLNKSGRNERYPSPPKPKHHSEYVRRKFF